jgi:hypothetical protein
MCKDWNICRKYCFGTTDKKNWRQFQPWEASIRLL